MLYTTNKGKDLFKCLEFTYMYLKTKGSICYVDITLLDCLYSSLSHFRPGGGGYKLKKKKKIKYDDNGYDDNEHV
jgi:hypothetical protein